MFQIEYRNYTVDDQYYYPTHYATTGEALETAHAYARWAHGRCSHPRCAIVLLEDGYQIERDGRAMISYRTTADRSPCGGPLPWCEGGAPGCHGHYPG